MPSFSAAHQRREDGEACTVGMLHELLNDLLRALSRNRPPAAMTMRVADACVEEAQVVVNLRRRRDDRAWIRARRALLDRDGRGQSLNVFHVGLLHLFQELPRVSGKALDVAALALRVKRVERQRRLARPAQTCDNRQRIPRNSHGNVLQVVLSRALYDYVFTTHVVQCRITQ